MDARNDFCLRQSIRDALVVKREGVMREDVRREDVKRESVMREMPPTACGGSEGGGNVKT